MANPWKGIVFLGFLVFFSLMIYLSFSFFKELTNNFLRTLVRLGAAPMRAPRTFKLTIPAENLKPGSVVAYKSYAQDVEGNWEETEMRYFKVEGEAKMTTSTTTSVEPGGPPTPPAGERVWYWYLIVPVFVFIIVLVSLFSMSRVMKKEEDEFEKLKEKWRRKRYSG